MPHISILPPERASKEVRAIYEDFHRRMSFPAAPNFIMTQGHSAVVARATWDLVRGVLVSGEIPRWQKELIFVAISRDRNCRYCEAAHIACCRMLGVDPTILADMVRDVNAMTDPVLRQMVRFALKCARAPQGIEAGDHDALRKHGLTPSVIVELIAMAGLAVYANIMADATGMESDEMFATL